MSRELSPMILTGEQIAHFMEQLRDMADPITGELHISFPEDDPPRLLDASPIAQEDAGE